jgi:hypothetical protein
VSYLGEGCDSTAFNVVSYYFGTSHLKLAASSTLPEPE